MKNSNQLRTKLLNLIDDLLGERIDIRVFNSVVKSCNSLNDSARVELSYKKTKLQFPELEKIEYLEN